MAPHDQEDSLHALSYLMTIVIHKLHAVDPAWTRQLLEGVKTGCAVAVQYGEHAGRAERIFAKAHPDH